MTPRGARETEFQLGEGLALQAADAWHGTPIARMRAAW